MDWLAVGTGVAAVAGVIAAVGAMISVAMAFWHMTVVRPAILGGVSVTGGGNKLRVTLCGSHKGDFGITGMKILGPGEFGDTQRDQGNGLRFEVSGKKWHSSKPVEYVDIGVSEDFEVENLRVKVRAMSKRRGGTWRRI